MRSRPPGAHSAVVVHVRAGGDDDGERRHGCDEVTCQLHARQQLARAQRRRARTFIPKRPARARRRHAHSADRDPRRCEPASEGSGTRRALRSSASSAFRLESRMSSMICCVLCMFCRAACGRRRGTWTASAAHSPPVGRKRMPRAKRRPHAHNGSRAQARSALGPAHAASVRVPAEPDLADLHEPARRESWVPLRTAR
jgi:hypothetical protein